MPTYSTYSIKLVPIKKDGCAQVVLKVKATTRAEAQSVALKTMPTCRLHDDEPAPEAAPKK